MNYKLASRAGPTAAAATARRQRGRRWLSQHTTEISLVTVLLVLTSTSAQNITSPNVTTISHDDQHFLDYLTTDDYYDDAVPSSDNATSFPSPSTPLAARVDGDLAAHNVTPCEEHFCHLDRKRPRLSEDWSDRGCFCDLACATYDDCCRDIPTRTGAATSPRRDVMCHRLRNYDGIYMVSSCPPTFTDSGVAQLCSNPPPLTEDPLAGMPVSSPSSRMTYRSYFCALCHQDADDVVFWQPRVECPTLVKWLRNKLNITKKFTADNLQRNAKGQWGVMVAMSEDDAEGVGREGSVKESFHQCEIDPLYPETVGYFVRHCRVNVATCATNWTDSVIRELCHSYTAYVYHWRDVYKNSHCALCNYIASSGHLCVNRPMLRDGFQGFPFNGHAFSILLDVGDRSGSDRVGEISICNTQQLWDPFFKRCRNVRCDVGFTVQNGACVASPDTSSGGDNADEAPSNGNSTSVNTTFTTSFKQCPKYYLNASEFVFDTENNSVYVPTYDRHLNAGEFEMRDGELAICALSGNLGKFGVVLSYLSIVCLAVSIICLVMHLVAFCFVPELRNLSGHNLTALCVCLLVGYACFLAAPFQRSGEAACVAIAAIMYAAFIASFCWMNVMAFDVFTTLRRATQELRVSGGKRLGRFACYTCYVAIMTSSLLLAALLSDRSQLVPATYRPGFGVRVCWFSRRRALMAFFAAPLAAIMGINVVMFIASTHMIRQTTKSTAQMTCGPSQVNLRLYARLAIIMGLSWLVGLIAGWLDFTPLWFAFVVLNTLQGAFIFGSFTMADKVRERVRRQASAAWSAGVASLADSNVNTDSSGLSLQRGRR